ncbi:hypothetical protein [Streptomyces sp. NBC_00233]|uniref:DUF7426 family protein n=1 Tax=Streptomyces sp. NBC_00233 TaxID=2975686 RepID=UPI0022526D07|nr:hypothetical protein [Streptomyces sp. NBC_00233]MCX5229668.1 hypothetical protein [Streptomyces sp. NBC_00233]
MAFKTLDEFLGDSLDLPVKCLDGKVRTFHIQGPSAENGLRVEKLMETGMKLAAAPDTEPDQDALDDLAELNLYEAALGDAYADLREHLDWPRFRHVALTAVVWISQGLDAAESFWNSDGTPSQGGPANREQRRASSRAAKSTPSQASRSGTSTPRATSRPRKAAQT